jgi:integrase
MQPTAFIEDRDLLARLGPLGYVRGLVASSTQNQVLSALLFLYREVLAQELPWLDDIVRARRTVRLPVVLTRDEVRTVIRQLRGVHRLMAILLYGPGLRLLEAARVRVKDVDFALHRVKPGARMPPKSRRSARPVTTRPARRQLQRGKPCILELLSKSGTRSGIAAKGLPDNVNLGGGLGSVARLSRNGRSVRRATWFQDTYYADYSEEAVTP